MRISPLFFSLPLVLLAACSTTPKAPATETAKTTTTTQTTPPPAPAPVHTDDAQALAAMGMTVREILREKGTPYGELGLDDPRWSDDELLDAIERHPILMNRPIVRTPLGTALCRPSEVVLELLPVPVLPPFVKEDGEVVRDSGVRRGR